MLLSKCPFFPTSHNLVFFPFSYLFPPVYGVRKISCKFSNPPGSHAPQPPWIPTPLDPVPPNPPGSRAPLDPVPPNPPGSRAPQPTWIPCPQLSSRLSAVLSPLVPSPWDQPCWTHQRLNNYIQLGDSFVCHDCLISEIDFSCRCAL